MRRRIVPVAVAASLVLAGLTGCAASGGTAADCSNPLRPGPVSDNVKVSSSGAKIPTAIPVSNAQRTVVDSGEEASRGRSAQPGDVVIADLAVFDASTGQTLTQSPNSAFLAPPAEAREQVDAALAGQSDSISASSLISVALWCATPGETLVVASTQAQSMAAQLSASATVAVIKVRSVAAPRAEGRVRGLPSGFPAVATTDTGQPGIVLPPQDPPTSQQVAARIIGHGEKVTADQQVFGQDLSVNWDGSIARNTWDTGMTGFGNEEQAKANSDGGLRAALTGYPVGSQLVILSPGDGKPVVHVVDIVEAV